MLTRMPLDLIKSVCGFLTMTDSIQLSLVSSHTKDAVFNNMRMWWVYYHLRFPVKVIGPLSIHHDGDCRYGASACPVKAHYTGKIDGVGKFKGSINYRVKMACRQKSCDRALLVRYSDLPALVTETRTISMRMKRKLDQVLVLSNRHKKLHKALSLHNVPINKRYSWLYCL
jgi:hypothetical protein